jgi:hypothetical protein
MDGRGDETERVGGGKRSGGKEQVTDVTVGQVKIEKSWR